MKTTALLAAVLFLAGTVLPMIGCEGESLTKAIPKTEKKLIDYAITQIYMVQITSGTDLDAHSLKSQIDSTISNYGEEAVIEKIKEIATTHDDSAYRVAAVFSIRPYVSDDEYFALADTLDDPSRASFDAMMR